MIVLQNLNNLGEVDGVAFIRSPCLSFLKYYLGFFMNKMTSYFSVVFSGVSISFSVFLTETDCLE